MLPKKEIFFYEIKCYEKLAFCCNFCNQLKLSLTKNLSILGDLSLSIGNSLGEPMKTLKLFEASKTVPNSILPDACQKNLFQVRICLTCNIFILDHYWPFTFWKRDLSEVYNISCPTICESKPNLKAKPNIHTALKVPSHESYTQRRVPLCARLLTWQCRHWTLERAGMAHSFSM